MNRSQNNRPTSPKQEYGDGEVLYAEKAFLKKKNKSFARMAVVIFALVIAFFLLFFAAKALFKVNKFTVEGNYHYTSEQITQACGIDLGRFMFSFAASDVEESIMQKCPYIEKVTISRDYPSTVKIYVEEIDAQYYTTAVGKNIVISPELKVLEVSEAYKWSDELIYLELPPVSVAIEGHTLSFASEDSTEYILKLIEALPEYESEYKITRVYLKESYSIKLYCGFGYEVLLGKADDMSLKLRTLSKILSSDKLKEHEGAKIDMTNPKEPSFVPKDVE